MINIEITYSDGTAPQKLNEVQSLLLFYMDNNRDISVLINNISYEALAQLGLWCISAAKHLKNGENPPPINQILDNKNTQGVIQKFNRGFIHKPKFPLGG